MFRALVLIASFVGASAFAPVRSAARSSALTMGYEKELGAQPPLGFFDPLQLLKDADQAEFDRLRYIEVKHGRIAQVFLLYPYFIIMHAMYNIIT